VPAQPSGSADQRAARIEYYTRPAPVPRIRRRRGRGVLLLVLLLAIALFAVDLSRRGVDLPLPFNLRPPEEASPADDVTVVPSGAGTFQYASVDGPVVGSGGPLLRYRVGVEDGLGVPVELFAAAVEAVLSDGRSWTADGSLRFQRVSGAAGYDFTVYLASPVLSEAMCREDGLETGQFTNCRLTDGRVVINSARWLVGVPDYGAPLGEYRAYAINHEVGHQLGHDHELCPGPGRPAPVMQQQTLGLQGCVPYGWPFRDGVRYTGPRA
jgi:Protein of unknown function (DUF3152).